MRSVTRTVASGILMLCLSGCSFLTVERLELGYRREELPKCSATILPVIADLGMTVIDTTAMAIYLGQIQWVEPEPRDHAYRRAAIILGAQSAIHAASAAYGIWQRRRCARARDAHSEWVVERSTPVVVPPGPPGGQAAEVKP